MISEFLPSGKNKRSDGGGKSSEEHEESKKKMSLKKGFGDCERPSGRRRKRETQKQEWEVERDDRKTRPMITGLCGSEEPYVS